MKITPRLHSDNVLVELDPFPGSPEGRAAGMEDFYGSGILRPDVAEERTLYGTVIAHGGGREMRKGWARMTVKQGDRVLVPWNVGDEMTINDRLHLMISEHELLAVVE